MSTETVNPKFNGNDSPEKLSSEFHGHDSSEKLNDEFNGKDSSEKLNAELNVQDSSEKLNDEFNGNDSSESPKPQLNVQDSSEQLNAKLNSQDISEKLNAESNEQDSSEKKVNLPEKRKREETETHTNPLWKTALCSYFRRNEGSCSHGESCRYAHGESELRIRPDNTWDPTSQRAKKIARIEFEEEEDEEQVKCNDVMMPDALDDDDGQRSSSSGLSKCLVNLPMKWNSDNLRCFLKEHGVTYKSAKKKKGMSVGFVTLENAEQVETAVKELDGLPFRNKILKVGDVVPRAFERKGNSAMSSFPTNQHGEKQTQAGDGLDLTKILDETEAEDQTANDSVLMGRCVRDVVTPLAKMPYADQLEQKKSSLTRTLKTLTRNARKACPDGVPLPEWILKARDIGGLPCNLEGITESPLVNGYRNKCEFSVGYSVLGKPTVGFLPGNFREGVTAVEEPVDCPNVSEIACKYAAVFQEFLQQSTLPIWNRLNNTGFWRQLTVREGRMPGENVEVENPSANISEVMLIVQVSTLDFDDSLVNDELQGLAKAFAVGASSASPTLPLTALVVQDHTGISNVAPADAPLRWLPFPGGEDSAVAEAKIHDFVNGLKFCISPTAFFQVNTLAAEKLYSLAGDWASLGPDTLLFDICCGTGTIGLTLANRVGMVVGIEMNASAVSDAQRNAEINGIKNCRFICGKAEDVIGSVLKEYLVSPPKVDGLGDIKEKNNQENTISTGKTDCIVNASEADEESGIGSENGKGMCIDPDSAPIVNMDSTDNTLEPEGKAGNRKSLSESSSDGIIESETQLKNCSSENLTTPVQHFKNVVAIVDPPRAGLHPTVIKLLRTNSRLRRLVYISCNPETLVANAIELCTPSPDETAKGNNRNNRLWKRMSSATLARHRTKSMPNSEPFQPVKAMAVDLFPHTPHCELVMLLER
ncbi:Zinc finger CCCH domain-containing protein 24 [Capsicum annuum]|uniref:Zinc finger CCCH domain-containing protein 24 n=1 Tax=Capsicum annuum TaxID=4072 RepID=A0A2G2YHU2_CAPAN|nr:Zinc finger CCCH domain-containing protein 24 [Capsicum annuum]PHT69295.1 Zinc finger CCCH domain-containing protein 24 [Capsicum annuum]